jgi:hypothetical protein
MTNAMFAKQAGAILQRLLRRERTMAFVGSLDFSTEALYFDHLGGKEQIRLGCETLDSPRDEMCGEDR